MSPRKTGCLFCKISWSKSQQDSLSRYDVGDFLEKVPCFDLHLWLCQKSCDVMWRIDGWSAVKRDHHQYIQSCLAQSSEISVTPTQIFTNVSKLEHSRLNTFDSFRITFKFIGFLGVWFIWFYRVNRRHIDRVRIRLMLISDWFIRVHAGLNQIINSRTGSFWDH